MKSTVLFRNLYKPINIHISSSENELKRYVLNYNFLIGNCIKQMYNCGRSRSSFIIIISFRCLPDLFKKDSVQFDHAENHMHLLTRHNLVTLEGNKVQTWREKPLKKELRKIKYLVLLISLNKKPGENENAGIVTVYI